MLKKNKALQSTLEYEKKIFKTEQFVCCKLTILYIEK